MAANTNSLVEVTQKIFDIFTVAKVSLGLQDIYWGDQQKIPRTPALAIDALEKNTELVGVGGPARANIIHEVHLILYVAKLQQAEITRKDADTLGEQIENLLHTPGQGLSSSIGSEGVVLAGNVVRINNGFATRQGNMFRAVRLVWQGKSKTSIVP